MKIAIAHNARFPVLGYGGTERAIWWLTKGLAERGHEVTLCGLPGTLNPFGRAFESTFLGNWVEALPKAELYHFFSTPPEGAKQKPYLVTIEGNAKAGETFFPNTSFVSKNHAQRHGGKYHVYNGIDLSEYPLTKPQSKDHWIFLAKACWKVKNVSGAIRMARKAQVNLDVIGGGLSFLPRWRGVKWKGMLGGKEKLEAIQGARGLLFPVLWHEPFGIALIEALAMGMPVVATPFGSLPELISPAVGFLATQEEQLIEGILKSWTISAEACRQHVEKNFTYQKMAENYEALYKKILTGESLHPTSLKVKEDQGKILSW